jgi:hypothetical protein
MKMDNQVKERIMILMKANQMKMTVTVKERRRKKEIRIKDQIQIVKTVTRMMPLTHQKSSHLQSILIHHQIVHHHHLLPHHKMIHLRRRVVKTINQEIERVNLNSHQNIRDMAIITQTLTLKKVSQIMKSQRNNQTIQISIRVMNQSN